MLKAGFQAVICIKVRTHLGPGGLGVVAQYTIRMFWNNNVRVTYKLPPLSIICVLADKTSSLNLITD
jgi:hypothetical protein